MVLNFIPHKPKRIIALGFIILGLLYATPPIIPFMIWTEMILNFPTSKLILNYVPMNETFALFLTFTLIPILLVYIGAFIYPHGTNSILHGIKNRINNGILKYYHSIKKNPVNIIWLFISLIMVYWAYSNYVI